ncbi:MAG: phosphatase [Cyclobacteriaceae bacterium]|nr:phosphatase [Cyclobacteriaceae bacterium]
MKFAAIDIGSNAVRLQITGILYSSKGIIFKKLEYVRFPLRLGREVFNEGQISHYQIERFLKLMKAFKLLIELYEVTDCMACATSAMREATNGREVIKKTKKDTGIEIEVISGEKEARMINDSITDHLDDKAYLHIDVGGGSTELNMYLNGEKRMSESFEIGSVRRLQQRENPEVWADIKKWVKNNLSGEVGKVIAVGTGGNINKMFDMASVKKGKTMSLRKLRSIQKQIAGMGLEERINELQLNPDRADVIVPASEIYISVMQWARATSILVPNAGLKDGMMKTMYKRNI